MRLIDKNKHTYTAEIESYKITEYSKDNLVIDCEIPLIDGKEIYSIYIKSVVEGGISEYPTYKTCTQIVAMNDAERAVVDAEIEEIAYKAQFKGFRIMIIVDYEFANKNLTAFLAKVGFDNTVDKHVKETEADEYGEVSKPTTLLLNRINKDDYTAIKSIPEIEFFTIGKEHVDAKDQNGEYIYLVPNKEKI